MAYKLPKDKADLIRGKVFEKADEYEYITRSRTENGQFINSLVDDPEIGGVLCEYMPKENVRTHIKDGILNAYSKQATNKALENFTATDIIQRKYEVSSSIIQQCTGKDARLSVSRANDGRIFVVSGGIVLKWETALRKALDLIANEAKLSVNGKTPEICLYLASVNDSLTEADKKHISTALSAIGVGVVIV